MNDATPPTPAPEPAPASEKRKRGRPKGTYEHFIPALSVGGGVPVEWLARLVLAGLTSDQIAIVFQVESKTVDRWRASDEFLSLVSKWPDLATSLVEKSLFSRATGFFQDDCEEVFQYKGEPVRVPIRKYFPPDPACMIFWLKNRGPDRWKDKQPDELPREIQLIIRRIDQIAPAAGAEAARPEARPVPALAEVVELPHEYREGER